MALDKLYTLAFAYKKEKLWKRMYDSEVFAVRLPDGEIGYCSVMGILGEHVALGLYVGAQGWNSYRTMADGAARMENGGFPDDAMDDDSPVLTDLHNWLLCQDCLQCSFENRDELSEEELAEVREAARKNGVTLRGPRSFPKFTKFKPGRIPWRFDSEQDETRMWAALSAALSLNAVLKSTPKAVLGLEMVDEETRDVLFLEWENDGWTFSQTPLPEPVPQSYPTPGPLEKKTAAKVRKLKKAGILECELIRLAEPVQTAPTEAPRFPAFLLCVDTNQGAPLPVEISADYEEHPDKLLTAFAKALCDSGHCPQALKVRTEATRAMLEGFCMEFGVLLSTNADLPALDEAKDAFLSFLQERSDDEDGMARELFGELMDMPDRELEQLPELVVDQLLEMADIGLVPPELEWRLHALFRR